MEAVDWSVKGKQRCYSPAKALLGSSLQRAWQSFYSERVSALLVIWVPLLLQSKVPGPSLPQGPLVHEQI